MKPPSQRFKRTRWTELVVPAVLLILLLALIATLVMVLVAVVQI